MPPGAERSVSRLAAPAVLGVVALLAGIPAYLWLDRSWRPLVVRLACALIVVAACARARRAARRAVQASAPSPLDARARPAPPVQLDERYLRMRDDLVFSRRSRRYFDAILWPRLLGLAGGGLAPLRPRRWSSRRGPSTHTLGRLIAEVERRL